MARPYATDPAQVPFPAAPVHPDTDSHKHCVPPGKPGARG